MPIIKHIPYANLINFIGKIEMCVLVFFARLIKIIIFRHNQNVYYWNSDQNLRVI